MRKDRDPLLERVGQKLMDALAYVAAGAILVPVAMVFAAPYLL